MELVSDRPTARWKVSRSFRRTLSPLKVETSCLLLSVNLCIYYEVLKFQSFKAWEDFQTLIETSMPPRSFLPTEPWTLSNPTRSICLNLRPGSRRRSAEKSDLVLGQHVRRSERNTVTSQNAGIVPKCVPSADRKLGRVKQRMNSCTQTEKEATGWVDQGQSG